MASEWELGMGMEFGFGVGISGTSVAPSLSAHAPNYAAGANSPAYLYGLPSTDTLRIDDLLDFSNHQVFSGSSAAAADNDVISYRAAETSSVTGCRPFAGESGSHVGSFADDIYIPSEEAAELEWLSKFVEESFSDVPYPASAAAAAAAAHLPTNGQIRVDPTSAVPSRGARSKRSRAASTHFTPNLVPNQSSSSTSSSSSSDFPPLPPAHISGCSSRKMGQSLSAGGESTVGGGGVRRCTHCASEKTPQWRTGPLGPKTLCNACGVRFKSGRLVPEYRPAASPTFVLTQHSNSHRKVMELRRQKDQLHLLRHENVAAGGRQQEIIYHN